MLDASVFDKATAATLMSSVGDTYVAKANFKVLVMAQTQVMPHRQSFSKPIASGNKLRYFQPSFELIALNNKLCLQQLFIDIKRNSTSRSNFCVNQPA